MLAEVGKPQRSLPMAMSLRRRVRSRKKLLQGAAVLALEAHVMDELFEAGHVLGLFGDVMENLLFSQHSND